MDRVVKLNGKITNVYNAARIISMTDQYTMNLAHKIQADLLPPLWSEHVLLPSG